MFAGSEPSMKSKALNLTNWLFLALLLVGFAVRMVDLTDAPLDFHPTRQLYDAIFTHKLYEQLRTQDSSTGQVTALEALSEDGNYEPIILQFLVAVSYLLAGGEYLWISRIWTSALWVLGGIPLFLLAKRFFSRPASLFALAFYLFQPFAITASRSFQPDPFMVALILWGAWALVKWGEEQRWKNAIIAGLLCGLALLVKLPAVFALFGMAVAVVLGELGVKRFWRQPQVWAIAVLAALPPAIYYLFDRGSGSSNYFAYWTLPLLKLFLQPSFYGDWLQMINSILNLVVFFLALAGVMLARSRAQRLLIGFWCGYVAHALVFPYQTITHDYYHLQIIPLVALSLAPLVELIFERAKQVTGWQRWALGAIVLIAAAYPVWLNIRVTQVYDYRPEAAGWKKIGEALPTDGEIIGLVHDYGHPLEYFGGVRVSLWPAQIDLNLAELRNSQSGSSFKDLFAQRTAGYRYFLVTLMSDLEAQPELKSWLNEHYSVQSGDGYLLYDLAGSK
jgi:4-amino-4-deoxy-L-arabinose transferase-like glycosyltransferase